MVVVTRVMKIFREFYIEILWERINVAIRRNACSNIGAPMYGPSSDVHTSELRHMVEPYKGTIHRSTRPMYGCRGTL